MIASYMYVDNNAGYKCCWYPKLCLGYKQTMYEKIKMYEFTSLDHPPQW